MKLATDERPHNLAEVIGQEKVIKILANDLKAGNYKQVYLFNGVRGTGKTTVARIVADAVNCEHPNELGEPCGKCSSCKENRQGTSMDVIEMDAASNNSVEDIRALLDMVQYTPMRNKKVFILDECHMLSNAACNALLKVLEEPPKNVLFIFCTTEKHKILPTIISRCSCYDFEKISQTDITGHLESICNKYSVKFEETALKIIAKAANGGMRDALSILEQFMADEIITTDHVLDVLGMTTDDIAFQILQGIINCNPAVAVTSIKNISNKGGSLSYLIESIFQVLIDLTNFAMTGETDIIIDSDEYKEKIIELAHQISISKAFQIMDELRRAYSQKNVNIEFSLQTAIIAAIYEDTLVEQCIGRIDALESEIAGLKEHGIAGSITASKSDALDTQSKAEQLTTDVVEEYELESLPVDKEHACASDFFNEDCPFPEEEPTDFLENVPVKSQETPASSEVAPSNNSVCSTPVNSEVKNEVESQMSAPPSEVQTINTATQEESFDGISLDDLISKETTTNVTSTTNPIEEKVESKELVKEQEPEMSMFGDFARLWK